jgi:Uma2 family endonuclease
LQHELGATIASVAGGRGERGQRGVEAVEPEIDRDSRTLRRLSLHGPNAAQSGGVVAELGPAPRSTARSQSPCYAVPMSSTARKVATYEDVLAAPEHMIAEVVDGQLHLQPRPASRHARVVSSLGFEITGPFDRGRGGPGGWVILDEPELHLGPEPCIVVPDLAGWRVDRACFDGDGAFITIVPDWICEVLSPTTAAFDRSRKADLYAVLGVGYFWLVDVSTRQIEAFRNAQGKWLRLGAFDEADARVAPFDAVPLDIPTLFTFPNER